MRIQRVSKWSQAEKVRGGKYFFYTKANKKEVKKRGASVAPDTLLDGLRSRGLRVISDNHNWRATSALRGYIIHIIRSDGLSLSVELVRRKVLTG